MDCLDLGALRAVFELLQQHYPERREPGHPLPALRTLISSCVHARLSMCLCRLATMYMLDAPMIFWALWKAVGPFIDPETKQKVRFVSAKEAAQDFEELFGEVRGPVIFSCSDLHVEGWHAEHCI